MPSPAARLTAVIPTLGRSPWLVACLEALRADAPGIEIVVVDQAETQVEIPPGLADRVLRPGRNLGFAAATNLGIAQSSREYIAAVNDDAVVSPGWTASLAEVLDRNPGAGAVQGVNVNLLHPGRTDGCGIEWNRWTQAIQTGHGEPAPPPSSPIRGIWGVSATAAIYRRKALASLAGEPFDPELVSYYEDVDLAARLRADGWTALLVPAARARHAGSITGATLSRERWRLIYGNRWIVARHAFGREIWRRLPGMALRDLLDLLDALIGFDGSRGSRVAGIIGGWGRAVRRIARAGRN